MLEGTINPNPDVPGFIARFHPTFPVGTADPNKVYEWMQLSPIVRTFVPFILFIDRDGVVQRELTGGDPGMGDAEMQQTFRDEALKLLNTPEPRKNAAPRRRRAAK